MTLRRTRSWSNQNFEIVFSSGHMALASLQEGPFCLAPDEA